MWYNKKKQQNLLNAITDLNQMKGNSINYYSTFPPTFLDNIYHVPDLWVVAECL